MIRSNIPFFFVLLAYTMLSTACTSNSTIEQTNQALEFTFESPNAHIEEPFLTVNSSGQVLLSWIEKSENLNQLKFAKWDGKTWSEEKLIASGEDWFVNWADYPQIASFVDGSLMAVFLQKSGSGTFAYDVMTTFSVDGEDWSKPKVLHEDCTQTEHGFVSMKPWGENMLVSWLDGRNTAGLSHDHGDHDHKGQMTLRATVLDSQGNKIDEWQLDDRVCDCCQTGVAIANDNPVIVFRDRSETEIRDIGMVRWEDGKWTETEPVYMDLWEIAACPVNGPRIATKNNNLAIAWYTAKDGNPEVKLIFSENKGLDFKDPVKVDLGKTLGRIGLEFIGDENLLVSWMENNRIMARTANMDGKLGKPFEIASSSEKRSSGFPQLAYDGNHSWMTWTDDQTDLKKVKVKRFADLD